MNKMNIKITEIINLIVVKGSLYDQIIDTIISPNHHLKNDLLSELTLQFHKNEKGVIKAIDGGYFNYFFIRAVKNQVHSSTSSFYYNCVKKINEHNIDIFDFVSKNKFDIEQDDIDLFELEKDTKMMQSQIIKDAKRQIKTTWFELEMFNIYYQQQKSFRELEREYGIDHCLIFQAVAKVRELIQNHIEKQIKNNSI